MEKGKECIIPNSVIGKCSVCGKELKGLYCDKCGPLAFAAQINGPTITVKLNAIETNEEVIKISNEMCEQIIKSMKRSNRL